MFHHSNLQPEVRDALLSEFEQDELPRNAFYGDGTSIDDAVLGAIRDIYLREAVVFPWQKGDVLMVDNFLASHGREPFVGPRRDPRRDGRTLHEPGHLLVGRARPSPHAPTFT